MSRLPALKAREVVKILRKLGFECARQKCSHAFFTHPDGRTTVVPMHNSKDLGKGLISSILDDVKITSEEFLKIK